MFTRVDIDSIHVGDRFRRDIGNIQSLKDSIKEIGLLNPITIDKNRNLIAGYRRLVASKELDHKTINVHIVDLDEYWKLVAELAENVRRKKMAWNEEADAIVEIDKAYRRIYGEIPRGRPENNLSESDKLLNGWNQEKTADVLSIPRSKVSEAYTIVGFKEKYERVANSGTWFGALSHIKELKEKEYRESQDIPIYENFVLGDCLEAIPSLDNETVRCVLTDPPYGINYVTGKREGNSDLVKPLQSDNINEIVGLLDKSLILLKEKMLPDSALYLFTNWRAYPFIQPIIKQHFEIRNLLVWVKNTWMSGVIEYSYVPKHEFIIYATKGKPTLFGGRDTDILEYDFVKPRDREHPTQKPVQLLKYLINRSTVEKELIVDPFAGVGSTAIAAIETNRSWFCSEIDPDFYSKAVLRIKEAYECH